MFDSSRPGVRKSSRRWLFAATAVLLVAAARVAAAEPDRPSQEVDLELVLAVDVSGSIDPDEAELQRKGYLRALLDPEVVRAIRSGTAGRIALTYVEWAGMGHYKTVVDWSIIDGVESAGAFADRLQGQPMESAHRTSLSSAIDRSVPLFAANGYEGARRIIDISGDGANNYGRLVNEARDAAVAQGITINGLPILTNTEPGNYPTPPDLDLFFRDCVIGGPGAFYVVAYGFEDFARAVRKKLIIEIAGSPPPAADRRTKSGGGAVRLWRADDDGRQAPPCDIGERRWMNIIQGGPVER